MPQYDILYIDPPWEWEAWSAKGEGRSAKRHYQTQRNAWITGLPVESIAAKDSLLFLWGIDPMLNVVQDVMRAWGFEYTTVGFYWIKLNQSWQRTAYKAMMRADGILSLEDLERLFFVGLGYHTRANGEVCFIGKRGRGVPRVRKDIRRLVLAERGPHSAKPPEVRHRIGRLYGWQRRVELFARERSPGWSCFGDQVDGDIELVNGVFRRVKR